MKTTIGTVRFWLRKHTGHADKDGEYPVMLVYQLRGQKNLKGDYSHNKAGYNVRGMKFRPENWDAKRRPHAGAIWLDKKDAKRVLPGVDYDMLPTQKQVQDANLELGQLLQKIATIEARLKEDGKEISTAAVLDKLREANGIVAKSSVPTFFELIDMFIAGHVGDKKSEGTLKTYQTAKSNLLAFCEEEKYRIDYDTIDLAFRDKYVRYLGQSKWKARKGTTKKVKAPGLSPNSVHKEIKNIRTFMNAAVEMGYTSNLAYKSKKFAAKEEKTEAVYLTSDELHKLFKYDFSDNKRLESVRDLFVFSSFVGLRYSDASAIKQENIVREGGHTFIKIVTQKTKEPVIIPCDNIVLKIFDKYKNSPNRLPPAISNQKYNEYIKEVCREAGLTDTGRMMKDLKMPLYECISSHTARRNFATNLYLAGVDIRTIRAITGHADDKSFMTYIKVSKEQEAKRLAAHMRMSLSKKSLKAV